MNRRIIVPIAAAAALCVAAVGFASANETKLSPELQAVKAAISRYHSFQLAQADGYSLAGEPCVSSPTGTMGYHAANQAILQTGVIDPLKPPILLYLKKPNGNMELLGAEYFAVALARTADGPVPWFEATPPPDGFVNAAPILFGRPFDGPMPGHNPRMPWHYDMHAWVIEDNPAGTLTPFNPGISCG